MPQASCLTPWFENSASISVCSWLGLWSFDFSSFGGFKSSFLKFWYKINKIKNMKNMKKKSQYIFMQHFEVFYVYRLFICTVLTSLGRS